MVGSLNVYSLMHGFTSVDVHCCMNMYMYMIKINEPQLPWLRTDTGLDVKMEDSMYSVSASTTAL